MEASEVFNMTGNITTANRAANSTAEAAPLSDTVDQPDLVLVVFCSVCSFVVLMTVSSVVICAIYRRKREENRTVQISTIELHIYENELWLRDIDNSDINHPIYENVEKITTSRGLAMVASANVFHLSNNADQN